MLEGGAQLNPNVPMPETFRVTLWIAILEILIRYCMEFRVRKRMDVFKAILVMVRGLLVGLPNQPDIRRFFHPQFNSGNADRHTTQSSRRYAAKVVMSWHSKRIAPVYLAVEKFQNHTVIECPVADSSFVAPRIARLSDLGNSEFHGQRVKAWQFG